MKISGMIRALEESKEMYGDIRIEILIQSGDGILYDMDVDNSEVFFNNNQYDKENKLGIQNFPY